MTNQDCKIPEEHEPDYRFTLANERTFLAWIRTALALLAAAVAVTQFVPELGVPYLRQAVAALLSVTSVAIVLGSALHWRAAQQAMRHDAALPSTRMPWLLTIGVVAVGSLVIAMVLVYGAN